MSNALGAETFALSHSDSKLADAEKLGVKPENFIITKDEKACIAKWARTFDIIICTAFHDNLPVESLFFKLLAPEGALVLCGLPETALPTMYGQALVGTFATSSPCHVCPIELTFSPLIGKGITLAGSLIGGTKEIKEMLDLAAEKDIKAWTEVRPMSEASQTVKDMHAGKARYRYVLKN